MLRCWTEADCRLLQQHCPVDVRHTLDVLAEQHVVVDFCACHAVMQAPSCEMEEAEACIWRCPLCSNQAFQYLQFVTLGLTRGVIRQLVETYT